MTSSPLPYTLWSKALNIRLFKKLKADKNIIMAIKNFG